MPLIAGTRLLDIEARSEHARLDGAVASVDDAMARLPGNQRVPPNQRGKIRLEHDLQCYVEVDVLGMTEDDLLLVVEYSVWESRSDAESGQPPVFSNTHLFGLSDKPGADHEATIAYHIRQGIVEHELSGRLGDRRDTRVRAQTERDPRGWFQAAAQLRNQQIDVDETAAPAPISGNRRLEV